MSFRAVWDIYPVDRPDQVTGVNLVVGTADQVDDIVRRLAETQAGTAKIWGPDIRQDRWTGHMIHAAIDGRFGYLSYNSDDCDLVFPDGDTASPGYDSTDEEFPAGSGVSLAEFGAALKEFLLTGQRPESIRWTE